MAFRNIIIESPAHLSVRRNQLIVKTDTEHSVPVEDISAIMLENRQSVITAAALSLLGQSGCALFVCDEKHKARVKHALPDNGAIRMMVITEKQFEAIDILLGNFSEADQPFQNEQLTIF